jgi:hypothetical protein
MSQIEGVLRRLGYVKADKVDRANEAHAELSARVRQLEHDVQEARALNLRLAEITDVVSRTLLPADGRDDAELVKAIAAYDKGLGQP